VVSKPWRFGQVRGDQPVLDGYSSGELRPFLV
jgi:hypothetical protein